MLSNEVCFVAALLGTLCPMSDAARVKEDLGLDSAACHCACATKVTAALYRNRNNLVYGKDLSTGKMNDTVMLYYVEVRRLSQGFGDTSWSLTRRCSYEYCNKVEPGHLCPKTKVRKDTRTTSSILFANRAKLRAEAYAKLTPEGVPEHGWDFRGTFEGKQPPAILDIDDPAVFVAVHWIAMTGTKWTPLYELRDKPFDPAETKLPWGFEEVLYDPKEMLVDTSWAIPNGLPRGIVVTKEAYDQLPAGK